MNFDMIGVEKRGNELLHICWVVMSEKVGKGRGVKLKNVECWGE